jgi:hypothetical protein
MKPNKYAISRFNAKKPKSMHRVAFMCCLKPDNRKFIDDLSELTGMSKGKVCDLAIELYKKQEIK